MVVSFFHEHDLWGGIWIWHIELSVIKLIYEREVKAGLALVIDDVADICTKNI